MADIDKASIGFVDVALDDDLLEVHVRLCDGPQVHTALQKREKG